MTEMRAQVVIELKDKVTAAARAIQAQFQALGQTINKVNNSGRSNGAVQGLARQAAMVRLLERKYGDLGRKMQEVQGKARTLFARGGLLAGGVLAAKGAVVAAAMPMLQTAIQFENLSLQLRTFSKDAEEAKASMAWIREVEGKTPFNLEEVTRAFISLKQAGLDPTQGSFMAVGDAAAATGKNVLDAAEALKDGMTGQNERLRDFGITGSTDSKKGRVSYSYVDKFGKQKEVTANLRSQVDIADKLMFIFNEKFGGAQAELAKGWTGIMSSIDSMMQKFQMMVMDGGPFQKLKEQLQGVLDQLGAWEKDGTMKRWADMMSTNFVAVLDAAVPLVKGLASAAVDAAKVIDQLATAAGGYENLGYFAAAVWLVGNAIGLIVSAAGAVKIIADISALGGIGAAGGLLAVAGALAAIAAALYTIKQTNMDKGALDWLETQRPQQREDKQNAPIQYPANATFRPLWGATVVAKENTLAAFEQMRAAITQSIAQLSTYLSTVGPQLVSAVVSGLGSLYDAGAQWMGSLLSGIQAKAGEILAYVSGIGSQISNALGLNGNGGANAPPGRGGATASMPTAPGQPVKKRRFGGSLYGGDSALVGEAGPELMTAKRYSAVTPLSKLGGKTTNISLGGITINGAGPAQAKRAADIILQRLRAGLHDGAYA